MRVACARRRHELRQRDGIPSARLQQLDRRARGRVADAGEEQQDAEPAHLVARVLENAQEREHVLHVRRLEELEPAPFLERDLPIRELDLEIRGHVAGAKEHGHFAQRRALLVQLENAIDHPARLLVLVLRRHERGRLAAGALREEILREALPRARDHRVRDVENRLRRAIVVLERDDGRSFELLREVEHVAEVRAAEGVDALRIVADDGDVPVRAPPSRGGCAPAAHSCPDTRPPARDRRARKCARRARVSPPSSRPRRGGGRRSRRGCAPPCAWCSPRTRA